MKTPILVLLITQCCLTATAVVFNSILLVIIWSSKKTKMGNYKYIMNAFTIFEALFAIVCLIGMPVSTISKSIYGEEEFRCIQSPIELGLNSPLMASWQIRNSPNSVPYCIVWCTKFGWDLLFFILCTGMWYCASELWMKRRSYSIPFRSQWVAAIKMNRWIRRVIVLAIIFYVVLCMICSLYLCPYDEPSAVGILHTVVEFIARPYILASRSQSGCPLNFEDTVATNIFPISEGPERG